MKAENLPINLKVGMIVSLPLLLAAALGAVGVKTVFDLDQTATHLVDVSATKARLVASAAENKTRLFELGNAAALAPDKAADLQSAHADNVGTIADTRAQLKPVIVED